MWTLTPRLFPLPRGTADRWCWMFRVFIGRGNRPFSFLSAILFVQHSCPSLQASQFFVATGYRTPEFFGLVGVATARRHAVRSFRDVISRKLRRHVTVRSRTSFRNVAAGWLASGPARPRRPADLSLSFSMAGLHATITEWLAQLGRTNDAAVKSIAGLRDFCQKLELILVEGVDIGMQPTLLLL